MFLKDSVPATCSFTSCWCEVSRQTDLITNNIRCFHGDLLLSSFKEKNPNYSLGPVTNLPSVREDSKQEIDGSDIN